MEKFAIKFTGEIVGNNNDCAVGRIEIGEMCEIFHASLTYWNEEKYVLQWKYALLRMLKGATATALITSMYDPKNANYIFWWLLYADGNIVHVQNAILLLEDTKKPFNENNVYDFIEERETVNEDGLKISEWDTNLEAISEFYGTL